jgi:uncharacterized protein
MPADHIRYDILIQEALRTVIRTVLADVAANGLPGGHHFLITFDTRVDGVRVPARLKTSYPEEMTIALQHQFWDLAVGEDAFDVVLEFGGLPERLRIPFGAMTAFVDPSVQFGLQFATEAPSAAMAEAGAEPPSATDQQPQPAPAELTTPREPPRDEGSAEVVRLDRFRKK